jgi:hypothetical protein
VKYNPGLEIIVYTSSSTRDVLIDWTTNEHSVPITNTVPFSSLNDFAGRIKIVNIDFQAEYNISNDISVVHKADFLRIAKLHEHGGVWFDFDILFIRPLPMSLFDEGASELFCFFYLMTLPTGFIACRHGIPIMKILFARAKEVIASGNGYQKIGPTLWTSVFNDNPHLTISTTCLPTDMVYPYEPNEIADALKMAGGRDKITPQTIGIHWFNGSPSIKKFINKSTTSPLYPSHCVLNRYLNKVKTDAFL